MPTTNEPTLTGKKKRERFFFTRFYERCSDLPRGSWVHGEEPDFIIGAEGGTVGVELTELHRDDGDSGSAMKAQEAMRERVLEMALIRAEFDAQDLRVTAYFAAGKLERLQELSDSIAAFVREHLPGPGESRIFGDHDRPNGMPAVISQMQLVRGVGDSAPQWYAPATGNVVLCDEQMVQRVLDKKNPKVSAYREQAHELWLLIVVDGLKPSSWLHLRQSVAEDTYNSTFDRVYLFHSLDEVILQLSTL